MTASLAPRPANKTSFIRTIRLTLDDVRAAAREVVKPSELVSVVIGDRAKVEAGLRGLNIANIEVWDDDGRAVGP